MAVWMISNDLRILNWFCSNGLFMFPNQKWKLKKNISSDTTMLIQKKQLILAKQGGCSYEDLRHHFPAYFQIQLNWSFSHPAAWKLKTSVLHTINSRRKTSTTFKVRKNTIWLPYSHTELNKACWVHILCCVQSLLAYLQGFWIPRLLSSLSPFPTMRPWFCTFISCAIYAVRESSVQRIKSKGKMKEPFLVTVKNKWSWLQSKCKCMELNLCKCSCDCLNTLSIYLASTAFRLSLCPESEMSLGNTSVAFNYLCWLFQLFQDEEGDSALWQQLTRVILEIKNLQKALASFMRPGDGAREYK